MISGSKVSPKIQAVYDGDNIFIKCVSDSLTYWTKGDKFIETESGEESNDLLLKNVNQDHSGTYVCHGSIKIKILGRKKFSRAAEVYVGGIVSCRLWQ